MSGTMAQAFAKVGVEPHEQTDRKKRALVVLAFLKGRGAEEDISDITGLSKDEERAALIMMQGMPLLMDTALADARKMMEGER